MIRSALKKTPEKVRQEIKRLHYFNLIRRKKFLTQEPEYGLLSSWVSEGDCVLDIGANVGHYSLKLSELVGAEGRVIAFEPVPETFVQLANNATRFPWKNTTLMNMGVSATSDTFGINIPTGGDGNSNYYEASLTNDQSGLSVMCFSIDSLDIPNRVSFVKIDAEGHEIHVLEGMTNLLKRDHPVLVIEGVKDEIAEFLAELGYEYEKIARSPNRIFKPMA